MNTTRSPAGAPGEGFPGMHEGERLGAFEERLLAELTIVVAEQAAALADPARPEAARQRTNGYPAQPIRHGLLARHFRGRLSAGSPSERPAARWFPGRFRLPPPRGRMAVGVTAVALTAALAAGFAVAGVTSAGPAAPAPGRISLDAFLGRAAAAARTQPTVLPGPGQIFYVKELDDTTGTLPGFPPTKSCQVNWDPAPSVGGTAGGDGTSIPTRPAPQFCASGVPAPPAGYPEPWFTDHGYPSWDHNGYPPPDTLPTDPAALRAALYTAAGRPAPDGSWNFWGVAAPGPVPSRPSKTDIVFELVGRLLQAPISSQLRSALYEVTAQLPGVTLIPNVADAAGRHGVQIALATKAVIGGAPGRCGSGVGFHGFILDPVTYRYLGERTVTKWTPMARCHPPAGIRVPWSTKVIMKAPKASKAPKIPASGRARPLSGTAYDVTAVLQTGFIDATR
jgi:hypothetical protein